MIFIYYLFYSCGLNRIIDLSDITSGSQLDNLPTANHEKTLEDLTKKACIIKSTMENKDFLNIIER